MNKMNTMKRIRKYLIILCLFITGITCYSQAPNLISYQTVIRNGNNELVSNTTVGVRINILGGPEANVLVYQEEHTVKTNINGLAYLTIGNGTILNGVITGIDWSKGPYFIKSETDPTGGKNYSIIVVSQILSAPYAIYANTAEKLTVPLPETDPVFNGSIAKGITATDTSYWNKKLNSSDTIIISDRLNLKLNISDFPRGTTVGNTIYWNGNNWVILAPGRPGQISSVDNEGKPIWINSIPILNTNSITGITTNSSSSGGNITLDGGANVSARGVVWSTSSLPTVSLSTKTSNGTGIGSFSSAITGLSPNTTYYVRSYATNSVGTGYGNEITFTSSQVSTVPSLVTTAISSITSSTSSSGGNITSDGGETVSARGVVWSTSSLPTVSLSTKTSNGTGIGSFSSAITGLSPNTTYYVRSYATNSVGTGYGNQEAFTTSTSAQTVVTSLKIENPLDTLIISKKHKYIVNGVYENGRTIDLSDSVEITTSTKGINKFSGNNLVGAQSGNVVVQFNYKNLVIKDTTYINEVEDVANIDSYLKNPIANHKLVVPVVIINFIPTNDGLNKDNSKASGYFKLQNKTLDEVKSSLLELGKAIKFSSEEGSKFRGYKNVNSEPYIGIQVIKQFNIYEMPLMRASFKSESDYINDPMHEPDYKKIFSKLNLKELVDNHGVKEIWFNVSHLHKGLPSYNPTIHQNNNLVVLAESNMSSPITGDISNSFRNNNDLPIYNNTYVVYGFNYNGAFDLIDWIANNIHVKSHQIEIQINERDNSPNKELWLNQFIGIPKGGGKPIGRCGNVHFPPNGRYDYDYHNTTKIASDIENWRPDGQGLKLDVNNETWNNKNYKWPSGNNNDSQANWLLFWYQSIPGYNNQLKYESNNLTNWWDIFYDWDNVVKKNKGLF
jgi:hypothetical protein